MLQNYEAGQMIGTALGNLIGDAIAAYREGKRQQKEKQGEWYQFVQDTLASVQLACEGEPGHTQETVLACRREIFVFNEFLQRHTKDFAPDGKNVTLLADAIERLGIDESTMTPDMLESAFRTIPKSELDKKPHLGIDGKGRAVW
jgi:hypothetical protein